MSFELVIILIIGAAVPVGALASAIVRTRRFRRKAEKHLHGL